MERCYLFPFAFTLAMLPGLLHAQGFMHNLPIGSPRPNGLEASSDGGMFLYYAVPPDLHLSKLDSNGNVLWTKSVPGCDGVIPDRNGGVVIVRTSDGLPAWDPDTVNTMLVQWIDANGVMTANRHIVRYDMGYGEISDPVAAYAVTNSGAVHLLLENAIYSEVLKVDPIDGLLWTHHLQSQNIPWKALAILPDSSIVVHAQDYGMGQWAKRISADGVLIWSRYVVMDAPALYPTGSALLVDDGGNLVIAITAATVQDQKWLLLGKFDMDAERVWTYAYRRAPGDGMSTLLDDMDYLLPGIVLDNGNYFFGGAKGFEVTPNGIFVRERICTSPTLAPGFDDITHRFVSRPVQNGWVHSGVRRWTDQMFGNSVQMPLLGRTPMALDISCFWTCTERTDIIAEPPPPGILSLVPMNYGNYSAIHINDAWPLEVLLDVAPAPFEDACELPEIVTFQTAVHELGIPRHLRLHPNPTSGLLNVVLKDGLLPREFCVTDALGREVLRKPLANAGYGPLQIDLGVLSPGGYLVTVFDAQGARHVQRVVRE